MTLDDICNQQIDEAKSAGTFKVERVITSPQETAISVEGTRGEVLNFCANNYLGLSNHPEIVQAAVKTTQERGFDCLLSGLFAELKTSHKQLEKKLADFHGMEDAILFPSGFDANAVSDC